MENRERRRFLIAGIGALGTAAAAAVAYPLLKYLAPRKTGGPRQTMEFAEADLSEGGARFFEYEGKTAVLIRVKGKPRAFSAVCTHLGCVVQWQKEKEQFLCPCHAGMFDAEGKVIAGPPPRPLDKLPVAAREGKIVVG